MSEIDWASLRKTAEDGTRPVPDGTYDVEVETATATTSSTGKPMIKLVLRIVTGPHATRQVFTQITLSADSAFSLAIFFRHMEAFGLGKDFFAGNPPMAQVAEALRGRTVRVDVGSRTFQGVERNEIKDYLPGGVGTPGFNPLASPVASVPGVVPGLGAPAPVVPPVVAGPAVAPTPVPAATSWSTPPPPETPAQSPATSPVPVTPGQPLGDPPPVPAF